MPTDRFADNSLKKRVQQEFQTVGRQLATSTSLDGNKDFLTCITGFWRGGVPFQEGRNLNASAGGKTQEAELTSRPSRLVGCKSLLNLLFQYPWSSTNLIKRRCQGVYFDAERRPLVVPHDSTLQEAFAQMSWGTSLHYSCHCQKHSRARLLLAC